MTRQEVASRLCLIKSAVGRMLDDKGHFPNDCFCGVGGMNPKGSHLGSYPMTHMDAGFAVEWMEREVLKALKRTKAGRKAAKAYYADRKATIPKVREVEGEEEKARRTVFLTNTEVTLPKPGDIPW